MTFELRDYQAHDIECIRRELGTARSVLYVLPTGGGKTRVFSWLADSSHKKGNGSCIVVHRQELVIQSSISLAELGLQHRVIAPPAVVKACLEKHLEKFGESYIDQSAKVLIGSVQTLAKQLDVLATIRLLIIDEAHHTAAGLWLKCFEAAVNAKIIGVTATPIRLDGKGLGLFYERMVVGLSMQDLIDRGYLCLPKVYAPEKVPDLSRLHHKNRDFVQKEANDLMDDPTLVGNAVQHYRQICPGVPAIAYCCSVEHAEHVAESFRAAGFRALMIDGKTKGKIRRKAIEDLGNGQLDVLTSCDIVSEGTDIPLVGCGIMLRPTESLTLWLQQSGRVLRPYPDTPLMRLPHMQRLRQSGRDIAFILDHAGNSIDAKGIPNHGLPQQLRDWELSVDVVKTSKNRVPIVKCPECRNIHPPASKCPECSYSYLKKASTPLPKTDHSRGLQEVTAETLAASAVVTSWSEGRDIKTIPLKHALAMAKTNEQVKEIGRARSYNPKWAINVINSRKAAEKKALNG